MADQRKAAKKLQPINASIVVVVEDVKEEVQWDAIRNVWLECKDAFELGLYYCEAVDLVVKALQKFL